MLMTIMMMIKITTTTTTTTNFPIQRQRKLLNVKLWLCKSHILKLNNIYVNYLVTSAERQVTRNLLKYLENTGLTENTS